MIADFNGKLQRIQVKTSARCIHNDGNSMSFSLISSTIHRKNGHIHKYTKDEVDYFVLYNIEHDVLLLVPIEEVQGHSAIVFKYNYKPPRNQYKTLNWKDYTFENIIKSSSEIS